MPPKLNSRSIAYFLIKSEPFEFSITDLKNSPQQSSAWDGIRNGQAKNTLAKATPGDVCFFYHSSCGAEVGFAGTATVVRSAYSDPTAYTPKSKYYDAREVAKFGSPIGDADAKWLCIDVKFQSRWEPEVRLSALKHLIAAPEAPEHAAAKHLVPALQSMVLFRNSRLSVQEVLPSQAEALIALQALGSGKAGKSTIRTKRSNARRDHIQSQDQGQDQGQDSFAINTATPPSPKKRRKVAKFEKK